MRYRLDNPEFRAIPVHPANAGTVKYQLLATQERIWVVREHGRYGYAETQDFGSVPLSGENTITFQRLDQVEPDMKFVSGRNFYWITVGEQLLVKEQQFNQSFWFGANQDKYRLVRLYPDHKEIDATVASTLRQIVSAGGETYAEGPDAAVYVLDQDLLVKQQYKIRGEKWVGRLSPIGGGQLLIGDSPFDLKTGDFYWDAAGATKKEYPVKEWSTAAGDPYGLVWFADNTDAHRLRLIAATRDGQIVTDNQVAPHELNQYSPVVLLPSKDALIVAAIGSYQGEEHLLVFKFKRT